MREAAIVATARTPITKAYRGGFNNLEAPTLGAASIRSAVERASIDPAEIEDCVFGCANQQGTQFFNIARLSALAAGLPTSVAGMTVDRQCSSGTVAIATAAKQIVGDGMGVVIAGGVESISLTQNQQNCQINRVRFCREFDAREVATPPPCSRQILSVRGARALLFGSTGAAEY